MTFIVKSLALYRENSYASRPADMGPLKGSMTMINAAKTELSFQIDAEKTARIMAIIAESVVDSAKEIAGLMTAQVIDQAGGLLENRS